MHQSPDKDRRNKILLSICFLLAVLTSCGLVVYRWQSGVDIQNQAVRIMFEVVNDYMRANDGAWPQSWEDLKEFPTDGKHYDPVNYDRVQRNVRINFDPDFDKIDYQAPGKFQAIRPANPRFDFGKDPRLLRLLTTIHEFHGNGKN